MSRSTGLALKMFLLIAVPLIIAALVIFGFIVPAIPPHYDSAKQTVAETMGTYNDLGRGEREAIQHITAQMRLFPNAKRYETEYRIGYIGADGIKLTYDRKTHRFLQAAWWSRGTGYSNVTGRMILDVAAKHGGIDGFKPLGGGFLP